jgi:hypothetical protein
MGALEVTEPRITPTWMTIGQAARGWGLSRRQAIRVIRAHEAAIGRRVTRHRKGIRTADFMAIPRGDEAAPPMIPDVTLLWEKFEALDQQVQRLMCKVAQLKVTLR